MKKQERIIETYIAEDGQEFTDESSCLVHEDILRKEAAWEVLEKKVKEYRISFLEAGYIPLEIFMRNDGDLGESKRNIQKAEIEYYLIESEDQLKDIAEYIEQVAKPAKAEDVMRRAKIKEYPCVGARGTMLGYGREIHTIYSDYDTIKKFFKVNGYRIDCSTIARRDKDE